MKGYNSIPSKFIKNINYTGIYRVNNISIRNDEIRVVKFIGRLICLRKKSLRVVLRNKIRRQRIKFGFFLSSPAVLNIKRLH
jgi:methyl coenzyme M reductase gamma subunit